MVNRSFRESRKARNSGSEIFEDRESRSQYYWMLSNNLLRTRIHREREFIENENLSRTRITENGNSSRTRNYREREFFESKHILRTTRTHQEI